MLLSNDWINNEIKEQIKRYLETNKNDNLTVPNPWDTKKAILRGKFITLQAYFKKTRSSSNKHSTLHLKELEKEQ